MVFNLSNKVLSDVQIKVSEKGLDYAPIQNKINEPEQRNDFNEFCRRMRLKWYFRNELLLILVKFLRLDLTQFLTYL